MITITIDEFKMYSGIDLLFQFSYSDLDEKSNAERIIELWTKRVYTEMRKSSTRGIPNDNVMSEFQIRNLKDAICEYGIYYLKNGDMYTQSGYNEDRGQNISKMELDKLRFPDHIIDLLRSCGLIRRSFA